MTPTSSTSRAARGEIEAAKQCVVLSKRMAAFAGDSVEAARRERDAARSAESDAKLSLKRAKERWAVVDVDSEGVKTPSKAASKAPPKDSKGGGEIAAAEERLSLAMSWAVSAAETLDAEKGRLRNARKEWKAVEESLRKVEKRLGVVELDLDEGDEEDGGGTTRKKTHNPKCEDESRKRPRPAPLPTHSNDSVVARGLPGAQISQQHAQVYTNGYEAVQAGGVYQASSYAPVNNGMNTGASAAHALNNYLPQQLPLPLPQPMQPLPYQHLHPQNQRIGNIPPPQLHMPQQMPLLPPQNQGMNQNQGYSGPLPPQFFDAMNAAFGAPRGAWNWNW